MPIPSDTQRRIAQIDVMLNMAFGRSVEYWRFPSATELRWNTTSSISKDILIGGSDGLLIDGDANAKVTMEEGGVLQISGNLNAEIESGGFQEIIIVGDVSANAVIRASGFFHLYVRGNVYGRLESTDSSKIWIDGGFFGTLLTGNPSTHLYIRGNAQGLISPKNSASLLYLYIDGFVKSSALEKIKDIGYTQFHASVGTSDVDPGLYPTDCGHRITETGNSYARWCVLSIDPEAEQSGAPKSPPVLP